MYRKLTQIFKRPLTYISFLFYFVVIIGLKVTIGINLVNIFTLLFIPMTALIIYVIWNVFYSQNIGKEIRDTEIIKQYFPKISGKYEKNVIRLFKMRDEIKKITNKIDTNTIKESLISEITGLNLTDLIEKYAYNCVKIQFIEDFLHKKGNQLKSVKDKINKLKNAKERYEKLNEEIFSTFETIQAQTALIIVDDISSNIQSKKSVEEINKKIETIETTNTEVNNFYTSICE